MRILVAEDDAALASFLKKGLESEHYAVDVSADGEQARAMAGELDFDLVVLDLNLPRMDGVTILRFLRTRKPSMPILVLPGATGWRTGCNASTWVRTTTWGSPFHSPNFRRASGP
jgi:two-component system OmpR family response regulator/two-component system response regulator QseB